MLYLKRNRRQGTSLKKCEQKETICKKWKYIRKLDIQSPK